MKKKKKVMKLRLIQEDSKYKMEIKNKIKELNIKKEFKLGWDYLMSLKKYIFISFFILIFGIFLGYFSLSPGLPSHKSIGSGEFFPTKITSLISQPIEINCGDYFKDFIYYFSNNLASCFIDLVLGPFLGIYPISSLILSGFRLGFSPYSFDNIFWIYFSVILMHGIFEIPAIIISTALGLKLGTIIFRKDIDRKFKEYIRGSLRVFIFIILPLLFIAALIEPLSPEIVKFFYQMFN